MQHIFHMEPCKCIFPVDFLGGLEEKEIMMLRY